MNRPQLSVTARDHASWRALRNRARAQALEQLGITELQAAATTRPWYRINNALDGDRTLIDIYAEIGMWGVTAADFIDDLRSVTTPTIELHINSPGGDVYDGIAIYSALVDHPATVDAHVDALAASAASFIAQAGDHVTMGRNAEMMIHDAWGLCVGNADDMRVMAEMLDKASDNIASIYSARAGNGGTKTWRGRMSEETWYSATEAVEVHLADSVAKTEPRRGDATPAADPPPENRTTRRPAARVPVGDGPDTTGPTAPATEPDSVVEPPPVEREPDLAGAFASAFADITEADLGPWDPAAIQLAILDGADAAGLADATAGQRARVEDWGWSPEGFRAEMLGLLEHADTPSDDPIGVGAPPAPTTVDIGDLTNALLKGALE